MNENEKADFEELMKDREFEEINPSVWEKVSGEAVLNIYEIENSKSYTFTFKNKQYNIFRNELDLIELKSFLEHWDTL